MTRWAHFAAIACWVTVCGCREAGSPEARLTEAHRQLSQGHYREAVIDSENLLDDHPTNAAAVLLLSEAELQLDDLKSAERDLERATRMRAPADQVAALAVRLLRSQGKGQQLLQNIDSNLLRLAEPARSIARGQALLLTGDAQQAESVFHSIVAAHPEAQEAILGLAQVDVRRGNFDAALSALNAADKVASGSAETWELRGSLYVRRHQWAAAEEALHTACGYAETRLSVRRNALLLASLEEAQLENGHLSGAIASQARLEGFVGHAPIAQLMAARVALARQDYTSAENLLEPLVAASPSWLAAEIVLGDALLMQGKLNQAELQLAAAAQQAPENASVAALLAQTQLRLGRPEDALAQVQRARIGYPRDARLAVLEGDIDVALERHADAAKAFAAALSLDGTAKVAFRVYESRRRANLPDATGPLEKWVAQHPNDGQALGFLGEAYQEEGRDAEAIGRYEQAVTVGNAGTVVLNNLAWLYEQRRDPRAVPLARRAYELAPKAPQAADTYGWTLVQGGQTAAGLKLLAKAAIAAPHDDEIQFHYASALARSGERQHARELLKSILAKDAQFPERGQAERLLAQL